MTDNLVKPQIFITGGTGYIGGSFLELMLTRGYLARFEIAVLVRKSSDAQRLQDLGVIPVLGSLDDGELLTHEASRALAVFNTASCDHVASAAAIARGLAVRAEQTGSRPILIHTSGAGVLSDLSTGTGVAPELDTAQIRWDDSDAAAHAAIPSHAPHRLVDLEVFAASRSGLIRTYLIVPPTVFGRGLGSFAKDRDSIQIPRLIEQSLMQRRALFVGSGQNQWANVHVADLAELYLLVFEAALVDAAPVGLAGLYYPVTEHFTWSSVADRIGEVLHAHRLLPSQVAVSGLREGWFWGSNVQLVSTNGHALGWAPSHGGTTALLAGIEDEVELVLSLKSR